MRKRDGVRWFLLILCLGMAVFLESCSSTLIPGQPDGSGTGLETRYLVVADEFNNRVLIYSAPFTTGEDASSELGQPGFAEGGPNQSATDGEAGRADSNSLDQPDGLAVDAAGGLYVADTNNCRVLEFQPPFASDMDASVVFGQLNFTGQPVPDCVPDSLGGRDGTSMVDGMQSPAATAFDRMGDLWVSDYYGSRVTEYVPPFSDGMAAAIAIGQPSLDSPGPCDGDIGDVLPSTTARTLCYPTGIAFDASGNLWVADTDNRRVLEFAPPFSTGMAASLELGKSPEAGFNSPISSGCVASATTLCEPAAMAFDSSGDLWVADAVDNRILEFVPPFSDGMAASAVLGQPDFASAAIRPPAGNTLHQPGQMTFDSYGDLIVSDAGDSRVLIFAPPFRSGMSAMVAIGQPDMTNQAGILKSTPCAAPAANTLCYPGSVLALP